MRTFIFYVVTFRIALALLTRTYFQADEYFQALEPAHQAVFGYGHLTWEWTTTRPIRSIIYPAVYVPAYWLLKVTGLDRFDALLIALPKIVHGALSAGTDLGIVGLARAVLGNDYVSTAALLSLTSFFNALSLSRTLSNSLETSLCSLAFAYYPWDAHPDVTPHVTFNKTKLRKMILFSALACVIRPTNAVIWTFLYMRLLWAYGRYRTLVASFVRDALLALTVATLALFVIDTLYYGKSTFTPYNFLLTNLSSVSLFYGGSPWHYYLSQALPILCTTALPFTLHGMYTTLKDSNTPRKSYALQGMFWTIVWSVGIYSLAGHKEWRFIHPLLPLLHVFAAKSLVNLRTSFDKASNTLRKQKPKAKTSSQSIAVFGKDLPIRRGHLWFLLCMAPATIYVVLFYCSGPISVLSYVRSLPLGDQKSENPFTDTVGFLTPCHSTPGHAYIHREVLAEVPGRIWALGCEPPLG
ncbi:GPI mannosyltransferase 3 [Coprinopsis cinerea AmutBmut pab1-1]|nr:GPI mannosyltransferase 3 [Coprinopsis cinerea AmutBmut pab1-1]